MLLIGMIGSRKSYLLAAVQSNYVWRVHEIRMRECQTQGRCCSVPLMVFLPWAHSFQGDIDDTVLCSGGSFPAGILAAHGST